MTDRQNKVYTTSQAAAVISEALGMPVSADQVRRWCESGALAGKRLERQGGALTWWRIPRSAVKLFIEANTQKT